MHCPKCGNEIKDGASFCGSCGNKIPNADQTARTSNATSSSNASLGRQSGNANGATASVKAASVANTAKATADVVGKAAKTNPKLFIGVGIVLLALIIAIVVVFNFMTGGFSGGQTAASFQKAFEARKAYDQGLPSTTYVNDETFDLTSCSVSDIEKQNDDWVTADIEAVVESDNYKVTMLFKADYFNYPNAPNTAKDNYSNYEFSLLSDQLEAKTGITKDDSNGLYDVESTLSDDARSCTFVKDEAFDFWFANSSISDTFNYSLTDSGWRFEDDDIIHNVTYKDIDGTYKAKSGDMTELSGFSISNLNPDTGSFSIEFGISKKKESFYSRMAATANLTATIDPVRDDDDYTQKDGYSYYFEASGSSTGGDKNAYIEGCFSIAEDGSKVIEISNGYIDVTRTTSFGSTSETDFSFNGTLYKQ